MKQMLHISAAFDQPEFIQNLVERLAYRRYEFGFGNEKMPPGFKALETSSTETYVSGTMAIDFPAGTETDEERINMPFITCFLFTCIKGKTDPYQLIWSSSMN
ncbi:MAG: hypothetical protein SGI96_10355 [Bacteroidota bacterium]|nr:hypothetical protein [Bacteroidota bacterium]